MTEAATIQPRVWHEALSELAVKLGHHPLPLALMLTVPQYIVELVAAGGPTEADWAFCKELGAELAEKGDVLLYGGKKKGEAAALFNKVARGIAIAAFLPGGLTLGENHFQAMAHKREKNTQAKRWQRRERTPTGPGTPMPSTLI